MHIQLSVTVGVFEAQFREATLQFIVDSTAGAILFFTCQWSDSSDRVTATLEPSHYRRLKQLFSEVDSTVRRLRSCPVIMPVKEIQHEMKLEIAIGEIETALTTLRMQLIVTRSFEASCVLVFSGKDDDGYVSLPLNRHDYKRFKAWLADAEQSIMSICKAHKLPPFLIAD